MKILILILTALIALFLWWRTPKSFYLWVNLPSNGKYKVYINGEQLVDWKHIVITKE